MYCAQDGVVHARFRGSTRMSADVNAVLTIILLYQRPITIHKLLALKTMLDKVRGGELVLEQAIR